MDADASLRLPSILGKPTERSPSRPSRVPNSPNRADAASLRRLRNELLVTRHQADQAVGERDAEIVRLKATIHGLKELLDAQKEALRQKDRSLGELARQDHMQVLEQGCYRYMTNACLRMRQPCHACYHRLPGMTLLLNPSL